MATENNPYVHELTKELEYSKDGSFVKTRALILGAPSMDTFDEATEFEQLVIRAFMDAQKYAPDGETVAADRDVTPTREEVKVILMASDSVKFKDIAAVFKRLVVEVGTLDTDGTKIVFDHFKKLELEDFRNMICGYVANFTFPSLFSGESSSPEKSG